MKHRSHGFTLMELMLVLAIAGTVITIGVPSFREFRQNNRLVGIANDMLAATQVARTEAIKRQASVSICPSANPTSSTPTCSTGKAFAGWVVFVDTNTNCKFDGTDVVLKVGDVIDTAVTSVSNGNCISFASSGFRQGVSGTTTASNTVYCDKRGYTIQAGSNSQTAARGIEVTASGRGRITRDKTELVGPPGWGLTCP